MEDYSNKNANGKPCMETALKYLASKPRTVRETENHLTQKGCSKHEVAATVERLLELGYLNDEGYAQEFVRTRLNSKPVSKRKLKAQLYQRRLDESAVNLALESVSGQQEMENAMKLAQKFKIQLQGLPQYEMAGKITQRLLSRGFEFSTVKACIKNLMEYELQAEVED